MHLKRVIIVVIVVIIIICMVQRYEQPILTVKKEVKNPIQKGNLLMKEIDKRVKHTISMCGYDIEYTMNEHPTHSFTEEKNRRDKL